MPALTALPAAPPTATETRLGVVGTLTRAAADLSADPEDVPDAVPDDHLGLVGDLADLLAGLVEALAWHNRTALTESHDAPAAPTGIATGDRFQQLLYAARAAALLHRDADSAPDLARAV